jgi:alpha-1,2-glucosyltransferase
VLLLKPLHWVFQLPELNECSTSSLRAVNIGLATLLLITLWQISCQLHKDVSSFTLLVNALVMSLFPVSFFFNFLYYTDVGSTLFVFSVYLAALKRHHWLGGLVSYFSDCVGFEG